MLELVYQASTSTFLEVERLCSSLPIMLKRVLVECIPRITKAFVRADL